MSNGEKKRVKEGQSLGNLLLPDVGLEMSLRIRNSLISTRFSIVLHTDNRDTFQHKIYLLTESFGMQIKSYQLNKNLVNDHLLKNSKSTFLK